MGGGTPIYGSKALHFVPLFIIRIEKRKFVLLVMKFVICFVGLAVLVVLKGLGVGMDGEWLLQVASK